MVEISTAEVAPTTDRTATALDAEVYHARRLVLLKAAADPIRLSVLDSLARGGARCHCDLEDELGLAPNRLAFHLKVLKQAGLVTSERRGRRVRYHLQPGALEAVRAAVPTLTDPDYLTAHCSACETTVNEATR